MELGFWIPVVNGIPDSLRCIPDSKSQDSGFYKQNFPRFRNPDSLTWGDTEKCFDLLKLKGILSVTKKNMRNRGKSNSCRGASEFYKYVVVEFMPDFE